MTHKIIIDTDPGIDDAYAIAYALAHPGIEVLGLTAAFGNIETDQAAINARYLCHLFGHPEIPVAKGSSVPFKRAPNPPADFVHGKDGFGNTFQVKNLGKNHRLDASDFIIEQLRAHPGEITLVCIAPLANIAIALEREPMITHWVKEVVIMGGAIHANGNVNPSAEANIMNDPEAAEKVFAAHWPVTLFPLDLTDRGEIPLHLVDQYPLWNPKAEFLHEISQFYIRFYQSCKHIDGRPVTGLVPHDLYPVIYLTHPEWFNVEQGAVYVHTKDDPLLGTIVMDRRPAWSHPPHHWTNKPGIHVCLEADYPKIFEEFHGVLRGESTTKSDAFRAAYLATQD
jgi:inosine-uridine nucleoside N-ribohydrolase